MSDAPILGPINHVTDIDAVGDFEKKHTPYIALEPLADGKTRVTVEVGHYFPHPNQPDHFIQWIHVYAGDANIAQFDFSAVAAWPHASVVVDVAAGTTIRAIENCNLHGLWMAEAVVGQMSA